MLSLLCACGHGPHGHRHASGGGPESSSAPSPTAPSPTAPSPTQLEAQTAAAGSVGGTVYDPAQRVYWMADANLAGDPAMRSALGVSGVRADGTMSYATALEWVAALNAYDRGAGYLGHHDWQLPTNPPEDSTCAIAGGHSGNSFGPGCTGSALGQLFAQTLGARFPDGLGPGAAAVGPLRGIPQGLYWTAGTRLAQPTPWDSSSAFTFTFTTGGRGRNTTRANYFHVMPVVRGAIGPAPSGTGLVAYASGPARGLAVYDSAAGLSWPIDAALAATTHFGVEGTTDLRFQTGNDLRAPLIAATGAMRFESARDWLTGMNAAAFAGATSWALPTIDELRGLHGQLGLDARPEALLSTGEQHGFHDLQRFFYWSCQRDQAGDSRSPCSGVSPGPAPNGTDQMQWAFNFQSGFQGTDEEGKEFFVLPYYPAP